MRGFLRFLSCKPFESSTALELRANNVMLNKPAKIVRNCFKHFNHRFSYSFHLAYQNGCSCRNDKMESSNYLFYVYMKCKFLYLFILCALDCMQLHYVFRTILNHFSLHSSHCSLTIHSNLT